jgi:nitrous oxide reductase
VKYENQPKDQQRREFIKKSAIVGAGVAATAVASTSAVADVGATSTEKAEQKGYQLSQHVLDYYKSADV